MTAESFRLRHRVLRLVLATHLPALMALGVLGGHGASRVLIELAPAAVMLIVHRPSESLGSGRCS